MKITNWQLRKIIREVISQPIPDQLLNTASEAYEAGRSAGFNNFKIESEMMGVNGGPSHPYYKDYMTGFDYGIDERTGRAGRSG